MPERGFGLKRLIVALLVFVEEADLGEHGLGATIRLWRMRSQRRRPEDRHSGNLLQDIENLDRLDRLDRLDKRKGRTLRYARHERRNQWELRLCAENCRVSGSVK